ncbi:MAG: helix-turn-helix transcriptional regulator [Euryarchaeota archaeon]|nr:helix-turn-helix transcriptional regulator [Euryarchaeota archaeon]
MCARSATLAPHDPERRPKGMEPYERPQQTRVPLKECPVGASLDLLARKWTFMLLRDVAFYKLDRYSQFLHNNPGITPRILSRRLNEMVEERLLVRIGEGKDTHYRIGARGTDALPILVALFQYGLKNRADEVFTDGRPRPLGEVMPSWDADFILSLFDKEA